MKCDNCAKNIVMSNRLAKFNWDRYQPHCSDQCKSEAFQKEFARRLVDKNKENDKS